MTLPTKTQRQRDKLDSRYREINDVLERTRYKPGWSTKLTWSVAENGYWSELVAGCDLTDAYRPLAGPKHFEWCGEEVPDDVLEVAPRHIAPATVSWLTEVLLRMEAHEIGEWLRYDGEWRPIDPHHPDFGDLALTTKICWTDFKWTPGRDSNTADVERM